MLRLASLWLLLLLLPAAAVAKVPPAADVAAALASDPVYVAAGEEDALGAAGAARLRGESAARSDGTVLVALVPRAAGRTQDALQRYANRVANALDAPAYSLLVRAGPSVWIVTTGDEDAARTSVQEAFDANGDDLTEALSASIAALAEQSAPLEAPDGGTGDEFDDAFGGIADSVEDAVRIGTLVFVALFTLPFVLIAIVIALRLRRARTHATESLVDRVDRADDRLLALGERIRAHDLDVQMPGVDALGVRHYERAVESYDEANSQLTLHRADMGARTMARIEHALLVGEREMGSAEGLFSAARTEGAGGLMG